MARLALLLVVYPTPLDGRGAEHRLAVAVARSP